MAQIIVQQYQEGDEGQVNFVEFISRKIVQSRVLEGGHPLAAMPILYRHAYTISYRSQRLEVVNEGQTHNGVKAEWTLRLHGDAFREHIQ